MNWNGLISTHSSPPDGWVQTVSFYNPYANLAEAKIVRKFAEKWGRRFELAKLGFKVTHWMRLPKAPNHQHTGYQPGRSRTDVTY
jgi:hypothetical protein